MHQKIREQQQHKQRMLLQKETQTQEELHCSSQHLERMVVSYVNVPLASHQKYSNPKVSVTFPHGIMILHYDSDAVISPLPSPEFTISPGISHALLSTSKVTSVDALHCCSPVLDSKRGVWYALTKKSHKILIWN